MLISIQKFIRELLPLITIILLIPLLGGSDLTAQNIASLHPVARGNWIAEVSFRNDPLPLQTILRFRGDNYRFNCFLDRRVNPLLFMSSDASTTPLIIAMGEFVESGDMSYCLLGDNFYIGPNEAAGQLLLAAAILRESLVNQENKTDLLLKSSSLRGEQFCQPKELLEKIAQNAGVDWTGLDRIAHDCWNAFTLSPIPSVDQIALILIGFNARPKWDSLKKVLTPISIDDAEEITRYYSQSVWQPEFGSTDCRINEENESKKIEVSGKFRDVAKVEYRVAKNRLLSGVSTSNNSTAQSSPSSTVSSRTTNRIGRSSGQGEKQISGTIQNGKLKEIFQAIETNLDLRTEITPELAAQGIGDQTAISCDFHAANGREAAKIIAEALGARFKIENNTIILSPR